MPQFQGAVYADKFGITVCDAGYYGKKHLVQRDPCTLVTSDFKSVLVPTGKNRLQNLVMA